jgi:hypothetical protein
MMTQQAGSLAFDAKKKPHRLQADGNCKETLVCAVLGSVAGG